VRRRHALQLFKTDMCKFFLQKRCENGDKCSYAHNIEEVRRKPDLTRTSMCKTMLQAGVCNDAGCRFAHSESQLRATHGFFKMKMCGFAQSGRCKHGKNCRFAHSPEELRPAKPPPVGVEEDLLLARQPSTPRHPDATASTAAASAAASTSDYSVEAQRPGPKELKMNDFIFGEQPPPPPEEYPTAPLMNERRLRRQNARSSQQQPMLPRPGPKNTNASGREAAGGGRRPKLNESDSADGSSWASGSSATEVPRSEHTGSPPPTTSDSSSGAAPGNGATPTGACGSASAGNGSGSTSEEPRTKAKERRPQKETDSFGQSKVTTLLITNIPTYLTQGALLSMFEDLNYAMRGAYDFYYCPWDEKMGHNLGYTILNFVDPNDAAAFQSTWSNKELCRGGRGQKPLRVMKASVQGLHANLAYFSTVEIAPCTDLRFRPLYRDADGILQPLPLNTPSSAAPGNPGHSRIPPESSMLLPEPPPTILASSLPGVVRRDYGQQAHDLWGQGSYEACASGPPLMYELPAPPQGRPRRSNHRGDYHGSARHGGPDMGVQSANHGNLHMQMVQHQGAAPMAPIPITANRKDYWSKPQASGEDMGCPGPAQQQVLTWPVMMNAMPWPMAEQTHKDSKGYQNSLQDMLMLGSQDHMASGHGEGHGGAGSNGMQEVLLVKGPDMGNLSASGSTVRGGCAAGNIPVQAQYPQLVPYMMMPVEAMVPVDSSHMDNSPMQQRLTAASSMHMMQPMWGSDEVYTD